MIPENSRQVMKMKQTLYDGSRKTTVNTRYDECLYLAPRPVSDASEAKVTGKDLYMHSATDQDKRITYISISGPTAGPSKKKLSRCRLLWQTGF